jgi:cysteine-rich repeat protein
VSVFGAAGITPWSQSGAEFQTDIPFWSAGTAAKGLRFAADGVAVGTDDGLLQAPGGTGTMRFRIDVTGAPSADGSYRFLLELLGRRSVFDTGRRAKVRERRCYTFVDLKPMVDFGTLAGLIGAVTDLGLRTALESELAVVAAALTQNAPEATHVPLAHIVALAVQGTPDPLSPPDARRLVRTAFAFRRSLLFNPAAAVCGNGARESGEACDGSDLGGFDCSELGFESGTLSCSQLCRFDTTACVGRPVCGNGTLEPGEECDDGANNSNTLPDACRTTCRKAFCGDGVLDGFEDCEGTNLAGETCVSLGYDGGRLRCDDECFFDDERCTINEN